MVAFSNISILAGTTSNNQGLAAPCFASFEFEIDVPLATLAANPTAYLFRFTVGTWVNPFVTEPAPPLGQFFGYAGTWATPAIWETLLFNGGQSARPGTLQIFYSAGGAGTIIRLRLFFLAQYDIKSIWGNGVIFYSNNLKFLKDAQDNSAILDNTPAGDVYSENRQLRISAHIFDSTDNSNNYFPFAVNQELRFYNRDPLNSAPAWLKDGAVQIIRNGAPVADLSPFTTQLVRLQATEVGLSACPGWEATAQVFCLLIDAVNADVTNFYLNNYVARYIETTTGTTPLPAQYEITNDGVFAPPFTPVAQIGTSGIFETSFVIDGSFLTIGKRYRFIHLWRIADPCITPAPLYPDGTPFHDFVFISDEYEVTACAEITDDEISLVESGIDNQASSFGDYLEVTPQQKLRAKVVFDVSGYGTVSPRTLDFASALGGARIRIYEEATPFQRNVVLDEIAPGVVASGLYTVEQIFTVRDEANIQNLYTDNGSSLSGAVSNQDWTGKEFTVEWKVFLTNKDVNGGDINDVIVYYQKLKVLPFDVTHIGAEIKDESDVVLTELCAEQIVKVCFTHDNTSQQTPHKNNTNYFSGGFRIETGALGKKESFVSPTGIPNDITGNIGAIDAQFDPASNVACEEINVTEVGVEQTANIYGLKINGGYALDFDKNNKEICLFNHIDDYNWLCAGVSFEAWVWFKTLPPVNQTYQIIRKERAGDGFNSCVPCLVGYGNYPVWFFRIINVAGNCFFEVGWAHSGPPTQMACITRYLSTAITAGSWWHLVWVRPENSYFSLLQKLYVNGALAPTVAIVDTLIPAQCNMSQATDGAGAPLYYDGGGNVTTVATGNTPILNDGPIVLGADFDCGKLNNQYFTNPAVQTADMRLRAARIYLREMTNAEVTENSTRGIYGRPSDKRGLILDANFNQKSGINVPECALDNAGALNSFGGYDIPVTTTSCLPQVQAFFGYPFAKVQEGGGAWILV